MDAEDLMLRVCRLVFQDPQWTPGRGGQASPSLIGESTEALSALHRAADALARMAAADLATIHSFANARRFYVPVHDGDRAYATAPDGYVDGLIGAYQAAADGADRAAEVLGELVVRRNGPSKPLAIAKKALQHPIATSADRSDDVSLTIHTLPGILQADHQPWIQGDLLELVGKAPMPRRNAARLALADVPENKGPSPRVVPPEGRIRTRDPQRRPGRACS
jgi:hypothetical protein